jgi:tRNA threonylcarbamoyladenosine biosynthesis protein TsaE
MAGVKKYTVREEEALEDVARDILEHHGGRKVFLFFGDLGAGKTTFIKRFCRLLGVEETVQSPTFSIINEYRTAGGEPVCHIDLYRMESVREVFDTGLEDYLYSGRYCFIEWPEKMGFVPGGAVQVRLRVAEGEEREITVSMEEADSV